MSISKKITISSKVISHSCSFSGLEVFTIRSTLTEAGKRGSEQPTEARLVFSRTVFCDYKIDMVIIFQPISAIVIATQKVNDISLSKCL